MLRMANVGPDDYLIDLGSGDGRVVVTAAKRGARALGVDLDRHLLGVAKESAQREGVAACATFREQNLFETDLAGATVVTTYLLPDMNLKLRPKILALPAGTRVVAHDYHMGDWLPDDRETLSVPEKKVGLVGVSYIYLWHVPAQVAGRWQGTIPVRAGRPPLSSSSFEQKFQMLTGQCDRRSRGARPGCGRRRLRGDALAFRLEVGPTRTSGALRVPWPGRRRRCARHRVRLASPARGRAASLDARGALPRRRRERTEPQRCGVCCARYNRRPIEPDGRGVGPAFARRRVARIPQCPPRRRLPSSRSPTARVFRGRSIGADGATVGRGGVQHRDDRLPGDPHRSRPTAGRSSRSPIRTSATPA